MASNPAGTAATEQLVRFGSTHRFGLDERALEHDRPVTLFAMACDHLMGEEVIRPGVTTVERMVVAARSRGWIGASWVGWLSGPVGLERAD